MVTYHACYCSTDVGLFISKCFLPLFVNVKSAAMKAFADPSGLFIMLDISGESWLYSDFLNPLDKPNTRQFSMAESRLSGCVVAAIFCLLHIMAFGNGSFLFGTCSHLFCSWRNFSIHSLFLPSSSIWGAGFEYEDAADRYRLIVSAFMDRQARFEPLARC